MDQTGYRLAYACPSCGLLAEAQITETGRRRSRKTAKRTLALTPCPDCGWRDPIAKRRFLLRAVAQIALAALLPLVGAVVAVSSGEPSLALSALVAAVAAGWLVYAARVRPGATVAHRVRFLNSGEVAIRSRVSSRKLSPTKAKTKAKKDRGRTTSSRLQAIADEARSRSTSI